MLILAVFGFTVCRGTRSCLDSYFCIADPETQCRVDGYTKSPNGKGQKNDFYTVF